MPSAVPSLAPAPLDLSTVDALLDAELELHALLAVARMEILRHAPPKGDRCTHCGFHVDARESLVVNRAIGLVYHPECSPFEVSP
jgi:hypothetical protein